MRNLACFLLAVSVCSSVQAQSASVAERVAKQNAGKKPSPRARPIAVSTPKSGAAKHDTSHRWEITA